MANIIDIDAYRKAKEIVANEINLYGKSSRSVKQWYGTVLRIREPYALLPKKTTRQKKVL